MIINGKSKVGNAKVYATAKEMKLEQQLEKAEEVIRFYADADNWQSYLAMEYDLADFDNVFDYGKTGGKRARNYFKDKKDK